MRGGTMGGSSFYEWILERRKERPLTGRIHETGNARGNCVLICLSPKREGTGVYRLYMDLKQRYVNTPLVTKAQRIRLIFKSLFENV